MPALKNQRHELFCLALIKGMSQTAAAIQAGYSPKTAAPMASRLLRYVKIVERRAELNGKTESGTTMSVKERKERLSELARGDIRQPLTAKEAIMSIAELSKLCGDYPVGEQAPPVDIVQNFVFVLPDGTRVHPVELQRLKQLEEE